MTPSALATIDELRKRARDVRGDEPLWRHVSFRIGGPADVLVMPRSADELRRVSAWLFAAGEPFVVLGQGSNVLIDDGGIRGVVVKIGKGVDRVRWGDAGRAPAGPSAADQGPGAGDGVAGDLVPVRVEAGHGLPHLAQEAGRRGVSGLEFAAGIPASVGGGVVMNAGAHGHAMSEVTKEVQVVTPAGEEVIGAEALAFRYRTSALQQRPAVVIEVVLALSPQDPDQVRQRMGAWLQQRSATQPIGPPSSGCIFRNPAGDHAGRLIDLAGAKGLAVGDAVVSEIHANYIVNRGRARAADVLTLIDRVRERVRAATGVELELEVKLLGGSVR